MDDFGTSLTLDVFDIEYVDFLINSWWLNKTAYGFIEFDKCRSLHLVQVDV